MAAKTLAAADDAEGVLYLDACRFFLRSPTHLLSAYVVFDLFKKKPKK